MAKTNSEKIDDLSQLTTTLNERLDTVRRDVEALDARERKGEESLNEVKMKLAVLEERLNEMKKGLEEATRRRWSVVPSLIGAIIGGILAILGQIVVRRLFP